MKPDKPDFEKILLANVPSAELAKMIPVAKLWLIKALKQSWNLAVEKCAEQADYTVFTDKQSILKNKIE